VTGSRLTCEACLESHHHEIHFKGGTYETHCHRHSCHWSAGRRGRLHGPRNWTDRWRGCPDLRCQNPPGIPDWQLISVAREEGNFNDLRARLGNDVAINAYREGRLPFPDGSIIVALHWDFMSSEENNKVFGRAQPT
jgi:hypothetical protein